MSLDGWYKEPMPEVLGDAEIASSCWLCCKLPGTCPCSFVSKIRSVNGAENMLETYLSSPDYIGYCWVFEVVRVLNYGMRHYALHAKDSKVLTKVSA